MKSENQTPASPKLTALKSIIAAWLIAIFALYTVFPSTLYACVTIALFLICAYKINTKRMGFVTVAVFTAITFFALGASPAMLAYLLGIISSSVIGGIMLTENKSRIVFTVFMGIAYTAVALIKSPVEALSLLVSVPMAVTLALCAKFKAPRVASICAVSGVFLATMILPIAIEFYIQYGSEATAQFKLFIDEFRTFQTDTLTALVEEISADSDVKMNELFDSQNIAALVDTLISLLPAIFIIFSNAVAFSAHTLMLNAREKLGESLQVDETLFLLSKVSAWLYIISFFVMLFNASRSEFAQTLSLATQNINLILIPSFLLVGIGSIAKLIHTHDKRKRTMHTVISVLALLYCGTFLIYPIAALGVITTFNLNKPPRGTQNS